MEQHYKFSKWDFDENGKNTKDGTFFLDAIGQWERDFHNRYSPFFSNCLFGNASTMILVKNSFFTEPDEDFGMDLINGDIDIETKIKVGKYSKRQTIYAIGSKLDQDEPMYLIIDDTMVDGIALLKYVPDSDDEQETSCHKMEGFQSTWTNESYTAVYNGYDIDKEWAAYDPVTNNLYTSWTRFNTWGSSNPADSTDIVIAKSTDGGLSWGEQKLVSNIGGNASAGFGSVHGSYPVTGPNGEVYVAWWSPAGIMFDKSTDEGETWLTTDINVTGFPVQWITPIPGIQTGVSFPVTACDRSNGPYRGTIYINWSDKRNGGNDADIWLSKSTDGGASWSVPTRVNDDGPGRHQFFNYITVDEETGRIYVIFYDRRNYTDTRTDVYLAMSDDGGVTFRNSRISDAPFAPYGTLFFGHYIGVCAHGDHVFATWMRMDAGELTLWGASVDLETVGMTPVTAIPVSLAQNAPNPFHENTFFSFRLERPSEVSLTVTDLFGNTVVTLILNERMNQGKHVISFSPGKYDLPSGMYQYSLITNNKRVTKKMIYAK
ncbi:MAG: T9SS type A sorting domain-containing protein [Bacteroidetes bacterium]|nr:T9SS type A sorting domain-containing protein [Bacteroidota bacterium]